jgi:hypothetical protein
MLDTLNGDYQAFKANDGAYFGAGTVHHCDERNPLLVRGASGDLEGQSVVSDADGSRRSNSTHDTRRSPSMSTRTVIGPGSPASSSRSSIVIWSGM